MAFELIMSDLRGNVCLLRIGIKEDLANVCHGADADFPYKLGIAVGSLTLS